VVECGWSRSWPTCGIRFAEPSITFEEEAVEIIGVILAGIIIGLLGKFVAPGNRDNIPIALTGPVTPRAL
jgi:hypothetical protein